jgi:hypothetical protein
VVEVEGRAALAKAAVATRQGQRTVGAEVRVFLQDDVDNARATRRIVGRAGLRQYFNPLDVATRKVFQDAHHIGVVRRAAVEQNADALAARQAEAVAHHQQARHFLQRFECRAARRGRAGGHVHHELAALHFQQRLLAHYFHSLQPVRGWQQLHRGQVSTGLHGCQLKRSSYVALIPQLQYYQAVAARPYPRKSIATVGSRLGGAHGRSVG